MCIRDRYIGFGVGQAYVGYGSAAIGPVKGMQGGECPVARRRRQLEDRAALDKLIAAAFGGAVEIARCIDGQAANRLTSIGPAGKAVEHGFGPAVFGRTEFKNRSFVVGAASLRHTIEIACRIEDHARIRLAAVGSAGEGV